MCSWDDVSRIATALPESAEQTGRDGLRTWRVREKAFAWERPLRKHELKSLGGTAPSGPILGVWVQDLGVKEAFLADDPEVFFTTPHFDGYAAILVRLERIDDPELAEVLVEAWLGRAPKKVAQAYLDETQ